MDVYRNSSSSSIVEDLLSFSEDNDLTDVQVSTLRSFTLFVQDVHPSTPNTTSTEAEPSNTSSALAWNAQAFTQAVTGYVSVLTVVNVLLNCVLIFSLLYLQRGRFKPSHLLVLNVVTADMALSLLFMPTLMATLVSSPEVDCNRSCRLLATLERTLVAANLWAVTLVGLDRYLFIVKHASYRTKMTMRKAMLGTAFVWTMALLFGVTSVVGTGHTRHQGSGHCFCHLGSHLYGFYNLVYSAIYISVCFVCPAILMLTFYGFVLRLAHKHSKPFKVRASKPDRPNSQGYRDREYASDLDLYRHLNDMDPFASRRLSNSPSVRPKPPRRWHQVKSTRIILLLLVFYFLLTTPYFVVNILISADYWTVPGSPYVFHMVTMLLLLTHTCTNPLFYGIANTRVRKSLVIFVRRGMQVGTCRSEVLPEASGNSNSALSIMGELSSTTTGGRRRGSHHSDKDLSHVLDHRESNGLSTYGNALLKTYNNSPGGMQSSSCSMLPQQASSDLAQLPSGGGGEGGGEVTPSADSPLPQGIDGRDHRTPITKPLEHAPKHTHSHSLKDNTEMAIMESLVTIE